MHEEAWRLENVRGSPLQTMSFLKWEHWGRRGPRSLSNDLPQKIQLNEGDRDVEGLDKQFCVKVTPRQAFL